ncbi:MAG: hypothetical protein A2008_03560 [Candidatus Wallbacteria bacterium GWC2_49_35]|uniref:Uncharacterized protein n=1 Tax=Candidatus Wallbacteria bacterium GWC2_49_35 TaxID=1817813 RepID=A0A1F7WZE5_9BACT|nr:MAG: hypothetical protein A2008_03560 [Candidatus Wallbacteria bacterium GWC2_49_35]HBC74979.1 hypothetical protein [Candidatus Wallbacteria bacterium]
MQAAGQLLYFIFLVAVFFVAPLWYQLFHNLSDKLYITAAVLYLSFTVGYYLIYVLMNTYRDNRGNLVLIGGVKRRPEDGFQSAESESTVLGRGVIEQSTDGLMSVKDIRPSIWRRALLFSLILLLLLLPFLMHYEEPLRYQQALTVDSNRDAIVSMGQLLKLKIEKDSPGDLLVLNSVVKDDVVIITGNYDRVEVVLDLAKIPYTLITPMQFARFELKPRQLLMINCPGKLMPDTFPKIEKFVAEGGHLFTTDWALINTLERAIPGFLKSSQLRTADSVVSIEKAYTGESELLKHVFLPGGTPSWWVFSSHPYKVQNDAVRLLVSSKQMKTQFNLESVATEFAYKKGRVIHTATHFYQQRSIIVTREQARSGDEYVRNDMQIDISRLEADFAARLKNIKAGQLEDTYSVIRFIANVIIARKKTQAGL